MNYLKKGNTNDFKSSAIEKLQAEYSFSDSDLISEGAFSWVFKATNKKLARTVALKIIKKQFIPDNQLQEHQVSIFDEAKIQASLKHNGIASIYKADVIDNILFFEMEYIEGISLYDYILKKERLSLKETIKLGIEILEILDEIHSNKIIHGDINTNNILIDKNSYPHLIDFGVSTFINQKKNSNELEHIGAREFISPEALTGSSISFKSDFYSFGVLLYECLTGKAPFNFKTKTLYEVIQNDLPIPFSAYNLNVNPEIEKIIFRLMAKSPSQRPGSAKQIKNLLLRNQNTPQPTQYNRKKLIAVFSLILIILLIGIVIIYISEKEKNEYSGIKQPVTSSAKSNIPKSLESYSEFLLVNKELNHANLNTDIYILIHEVTVEQFNSFAEKTGYVTDSEKNNMSLTYTPNIGLQRARGINWRHDENGNLLKSNAYKNRPVVHVSWNDAVAYCEWANARLPYHDEWYQLAYPGDSTLLLSEIYNTAWYSENAMGSIKKIKSKSANKYGLYDMLGNVAEWCSDSTNTNMPVCGGNISSTIYNLNINSRPDYYNKTYSDGLTGFRIIKLKNK